MDHLIVQSKSVQTSPPIFLIPFYKLNQSSVFKYIFHIMNKHAITWQKRQNKLSKTITLHLIFTNVSPYFEVGDIWPRVIAYIFQFFQHLYIKGCFWINLYFQVHQKGKRNVYNVLYSTLATLCPFWTI